MRHRKYTGSHSAVAGHKFCTAGRRLSVLLLVEFRLGVFAKPASRCPTETTALRSSRSSEGAPIQFFNKAGADLELFWVDFKGDEQLLAHLPFKGSLPTQNSYIGHVWRVRNSDGILLLEQEVTRDQQMVEIFACDAEAGQTSEDEEWLQQHGQRSSSALAHCPLGAFLSEVPMPGFHVICVLPRETEQEPQRLCIFKDDAERDSCSAAPLFDGKSPEDLIAKLTVVLRLPRRKPPKQKMVVFTGSGRPIKQAEELLPKHRRILILIEGGVWQWPPVRVGYIRPLFLETAHGKRQIQLETLALRPKVFEVKGFIDEEQCDRILHKAGPHMKKSVVSLKDVDQGRLDDDWRTSQTYFLSTGGDKVLLDIDRNVQSLVRIPILHAEYIQVLRYDYMGRYTSHHDYFDPKDYQQSKDLLEMTEGGPTNRLLTVFMYMSDVEEGGETVFPRLNGKITPSDFGDCTQGLAVRPQRGKVMIFYSMLPNGELDPLSLHGGCRVKNGTKWSGNFWFWNKPRGYKKEKRHKDMVADLPLGALVTDQAEEEELQLLAAAADKAEL